MSSVGALELMGMGIALMLDQRQLADPRIGRDCQEFCVCTHVGQWDQILRPPCIRELSVLFRRP